MSISGMLLKGQQVYRVVLLRVQNQGKECKDLDSNSDTINNQPNLTLDK